MLFWHSSLPDVLGRLTTIPIDDRILDLIANIAWYSDRVTDIVPEKIFEAVTNVVKGKEGIEMAEMIKNGIFKQGKIEGKVESIQTFLHARFGQVPSTISDELSRRTDLVALQSLLVLAAHCKTLDEFADGLK